METEDKEVLGKIPESVETSFYKSMGVSDFVISKTECTETGKIKIYAKCLNCDSKGVPKLVLGDNKSCGNFTKHLKSQHPDQYERFVQQKQDTKRPKLSDGQTTLEGFKVGFTSGKKKLLDKLIVKYVVNGMHPLKTVEDEDFRALLRGALQDPAISFMDRKSLKTKIYSDWETTKMTIINVLEGVTICCLTSDLWSSRSKSYIGVTAHWIRDDLTRENIILACRRFKGTHSYDKIASELNHVMNEFGIPRKKVVAVVTDNGSNFVKAFKEFGLDYEETFDVDAEAESDQEFDDYNIEQVRISETMDDGSMETSKSLPPHLRCVAHTLNLVATTDVKNVLGKSLFHKAIGKCTKLFNLSTSPKSADIIRKICGKDLKRPVVTRWNSLYDAIKHLLSLEAHLEELCESLRIPFLSKKELDFLKEYVKISEPLAVALDKLQGDKNVYLGELVPTLRGLIYKLNQLKSSLQYTADFLEAMLDGIQKRFRSVTEIDVDNPSDFVYAAMSHPYFKARWIPLSLRGQLIKAFVTRCTELTANNPQKSFSQPTDCEDLDNDLYEFFETETTMTDEESRVQLECVQYFEDKDMSFHVLEKFPSIRKIFRRYNTALPSSASAERLFSSAGLILAPRRSRLSDELFNILVFLKCNSHFNY